MFKILTRAVALAALMASPSFAETFEVQMLNKGEAGAMVFEPAFLRLAMGDTVKFVAASKGHNAETIKGMLPEGAAPFSGKINEEIEVTFDTEGVYGIACKPHFAMGMVMVIAVGDAQAPDDFLAGRLPKKAKERLEAALASQ
jgi:pseudoazurin